MPVSALKKSSTGTYRIALLGAGTVGGELAAIIGEASGRHGCPAMALTQVLVRDTSKPRSGLDAKLLRGGPEHVDIENIDVLVEVMGGIEPARTLILKALRAGVPVITANKALLARHGEEILAAARESGVALRFEAAVGAATPCIRALRDTLKGVPIRRVYGVLNGTSHFILNEIRTPGMSLASAMALAQQKGYAERDPRADLEGHDAAQKLAILGWCISGHLIDSGKIPRVELPTLSPETVLAAAHIGFTVKPLASLSWTKNGRAEAWIAPAAVSSASPLAATLGAEASVLIETRRAGVLSLSAPGAGGGPTASAVFDDLVDVLSGGRPEPHLGARERVDAGGADDPREWVVHAPLSAKMDGVKLAKHIAACEGDIQRFENMNDNGWIAHVSGVSYHPGFTEPLTEAGACVLEVVK